MSNVSMTDGSEILDESKPFSIVAVVAFVLSLLGILSILFVPFVPVALAAVGLGILAKILGRKNDYNFFSKVAALLAVAIGVLSVTTGVLAKNFSTEADLLQAKKVAETYFDLIHKQDFDRVALINGMESPPEEFQSRKPTEQEKFLFKKRTLQANPVYKEIASLPSTPKWQFVRLEAEESTSYFCDYRLIYRDENRAKSPLYKVGIRRDQPKGGPLVHPEKRGRELTEEDFKVLWTVEFLEKMR
ncbi:MAG: hypothetical protein MUC43_10975 [Pirellula sp.]|jgi:hypothetical protein|nr:hypothetical protein [Pirellula sp.]